MIAAQLSQRTNGNKHNAMKQNIYKNTKVKYKWYQLDNIFINK